MTAKLSGASFGDAGRHIVIEEGMVGEECSLLVLCDGTRAVPLVPAQDFKRIGDGDTGPNTGGMGAYAPMPLVDAAAVDRIMDAAVLPLVEELRRRGIDYRGVLYAGLMLTSEGPKVIEYNVRLGDPEAQVVLPLLASDAAELFLAAANGELSTTDPPAFSGDAAVCVVMASQGYPEHPRTGDTIEGLSATGQSVADVEGVTVFHAGTGRHDRTGAVPHGRRTCAGRHRGGADARGRPASGRTRPRRRSSGRACRCATTSRRGRPARRWPRRRGAPDDPALLPAGHGRAVQRHGAVLALARGRAPGHRGPGRARRGPGRGRRDLPGQGARRSTTSSWPTCSSARRSPTTTSPRSSTCVQERIGAPAGSLIHFGLTSSDVVDTALCATLTKAADLLLADLDAFVAALKARAARAAARPGDRAHPRHARRAHDLRGQVRPVGPAGRPRPPAPAGRPRGRRRGQAVRGRRHLLEHRPRGRGAGLRRPRASRRCPRPRSSPATATPSTSPPAPPSGPPSSSCAPRSATWPAARWARWRSRSAAGQKGSSAMPHKRNPILSERLCGLARLLRGYLGAGLEDVALWHERDISHSSVERVALPDASLLTCYMLRKATGLADGLVIHPERALAEPDRGLARARLLAVRPPRPRLGGLTRDEAYRIVQRDARAAWSGAAPVPRRARGRPRGDARRRAARRRLRPRRAPCATSTASPTRVVTL